MPASSLCRASMLLAMRVSASVSQSSIIPTSAPAYSDGIRADRPLIVDEGADVLAEDDPLDVALSEQVEDDDRHQIVHAQGQRSAVHDRKAPIEHLQV